MNVIRGGIKYFLHMLISNENSINYRIISPVFAHCFSLSLFKKEEFYLIKTICDNSSLIISFSFGEKQMLHAIYRKLRVGI